MYFPHKYSPWQHQNTVRQIQNSDRGKCKIATHLLFFIWPNDLKWSGWVISICALRSWDINSRYRVVIWRCQVCKQHALTLNYWCQIQYRCNRLKGPLARLSGLWPYDLGHNGHGINMHGVIKMLVDKWHAGETFWQGGGGALSPSTPVNINSCLIV